MKRLGATKLVRSPRVVNAAVAGCAALAVLALPADARAPALKPTSRVSVDGLGPVRIGMTKGQAERAAGTRIVDDGRPSDGCSYAEPRDRRIQAAFMLIDNRVARVDVYKRGVRSQSGVRVGDSQASVRRRLAGRLTISRHKYNRSGFYLEERPRSTADANRRVLYETDGRRITRFRGGRLPEVRYVEGCG